MLREEELTGSPNSSGINSARDQDNKDRDYSFIQNRIPSPLNNNFLLSAEQSRHTRQPSEGFIGATNNLMTQDDFRMGTFIVLDQDQIEEADDSKEMDKSQITLFTDEDEEEKYGSEEDIVVKLEQVVQTTQSNYETNNYNYSESGYPYNASQSLGAIIQGNGSFVGGNRSDYNPSKPGRESNATPYYYDENSLMNLSNTPSMMRVSNLTKFNKEDRIISSTKLNHKNNTVEPIEERREEQDASMLPSSHIEKHYSFFKEHSKTQDESLPKKPNPLELPLQRNTQSSNSSNSPWMHTITLPQQITNQQAINDQLFSRAKVSASELQQQQQQQQLLQNQADSMSDSNSNAQEEIYMIKKKLDFSRLSSQQNLNQSNYIQLNTIQPTSFMFQTYQSQGSNQSLGADTQHFSSYQGCDTERYQVPFEEILLEQKIGKYVVGSRNAGKGQFYTHRTSMRDEGIQACPGNDYNDTEEKSFSGISPPSKTKIKQNRPPLVLKNQQQQQQNAPFSYNPQKISINSVTNPRQQVGIVQQNCINIFQGPYHQNNGMMDPFNTLTYIQQLQVPPQSRTNSTNSYNASLVENVHQTVPSASYSRQLQSHKMSFKPTHPDTPKEPSSVYEGDDFTSQVTQRSAIPAAMDLFTQIRQKAFTQIETHQSDEREHDAILDDDSKEHIKTKHLKIKNKTIKGIKTIRTVGEKTVKTQSFLQKNSCQAAMAKTINLQKEKSSQQTKTLANNTMSIKQILSSNQMVAVQKLLKTNNTLQELKRMQSQLSSTQNLPAHSQLNSGRSLPNSSQSSAQNSFMQAIKKEPKTVTVSKQKPSQEDEKVKKLKKTTKSISRPQNMFTETASIITSRGKETSKCNTQRSVSKLTKEKATLGKKKGSTVSLIAQGKENVRPLKVKGGNKSSKVRKPCAEDNSTQSFETTNMLSAQEYFNQQRLSYTQLQGLFNTIDGDFLKSTDQFKTQGPFDHCDTDPYFQFGSQETQKASARVNSKVKVNKRDKSKKTANRLQSPYDSQGMKNKFSSKLHKDKSGSICKQIDEMSSNDSCNRCHELLNMLQNTRFLAR